MVLDMSTLRLILYDTIVENTQILLSAYITVPTIQSHVICPVKYDPKIHKIYNRAKIAIALVIFDLVPQQALD